MRLCSYVVVHDSGFAPNPFAGFCTLAACTPNHQGIRLNRGDWILGNSSASTGNRLIYAMRVSEVLDFDSYFRDPRYQGKNARSGSWQERCGDNIYFRGDNGEWKQARAFYHTEPHHLFKDTRHPRVYVSDHFFYFGASAPPMPEAFYPLVQTRQGCRCNHPPEVVRGFVEWLERTYPSGLHGEPRDNKNRAQAGGDELVQLTNRAINAGEDVDHYGGEGAPSSSAQRRGCRVSEGKPGTC